MSLEKGKGAEACGVQSGFEEQGVAGVRLALGELWRRQEGEPDRPAEPLCGRSVHLLSLSVCVFLWMPQSDCGPAHSPGASVFLLDQHAWLGPGALFLSHVTRTLGSGRPGLVCLWHSVPSSKI